VACLISTATAQPAKPKAKSRAEIPAETPAENVPATKADAGRPEGFIAAKVKADAPQEIRTFFEASDQARLAAIEALVGKMEANHRKAKAAQRRRPKAEEEDPETGVASADFAGPGRAIAALLKDVGYVAPYETVPRPGEQKFLKPGLILRFGHPVRVVRVIDKDRAIITVEQQFRVPKRLNSDGREIEPFEMKRVPAVVQTSTAAMKDGAKTQIKATLHVTGTETIDGDTVYVLESLRMSDYLEE
jgi:hypothetical protein